MLFVLSIQCHRFQKHRVRSIWIAASAKSRRIEETSSFNLAVARRVTRSVRAAGRDASDESFDRFARLISDVSTTIRSIELFARLPRSPTISLLHFADASFSNTKERNFGKKRWNRRKRANAIVQLFRRVIAVVSREPFVRGASIASKYRMRRKNATPQVVENERRKREGREAWNSAGILAAEEPEVEDPS